MQGSQLHLADVRKSPDEPSDGPPYGPLVALSISHEYHDRGAVRDQIPPRKPAPNESEPHKPRPWKDQRQCLDLH